MNLATLSELTENQARGRFERLRWPNGPICPHCDSKRIVRLNCKSARAGLLRCKDCRRQFTVTIGSIFEDSHIPLRKWLLAIHLMCSSKKGISALQLKRNLGLAYKSAWFMCHRIRWAMRQPELKAILKGAVEADETYIGGKSRLGIRGRGSERKTPVFALVKRNGNVHSRVVARVDGETLQSAIREMVHKNSTIYTDEFPSYNGIGKHFKGGHKIVKHRHGQYVNGAASTNTAESYFSLLKRGVIGVFHQVSKKHLERYCAEFDFRWNQRQVDDNARTEALIQQSAGKRLMYRESVGA